MEDPKHLWTCNKYEGGECSCGFYECKACEQEVIYPEYLPNAIHTCQSTKSEEGIAFRIGDTLFSLGNVYNEQGVEITAEVGKHIHSLLEQKKKDQDKAAYERGRRDARESILKEVKEMVIDTVGNSSATVEQILVLLTPTKQDKE